MVKYLLIDIDHLEVIMESNHSEVLEKAIEKLVDGNYRDEDRYIIVRK